MEHQSCNKCHDCLVEKLSQTDAAIQELYDIQVRRFKEEYLKRENEWRAKGLHLLCKKCGNFSISRKSSVEHAILCKK